LRRLTILKIITAGILFLSLSIGYAQEPTAGDLSVQNSAICLDVINRKPVGASNIFPKNAPKLFCFTKIVGAEKPTSVTHIWYQNGLLKAKVKLPVKSAGWRTWSSMALTPDKASGEWMVEIVSEDGVALDSIIFIVK
jgi:hypothetical protein